jgi:hypothetical protein
MKFENSLEAKIVVEFKEPELAKQYYIEGDWAKSFNQYDDLLELSASIVYAFAHSPEAWEHVAYARYIEGFGNFVLKAGSKEYVLTIKEGYDISKFGGVITIRIEDELEVTYTEEVK